MKSKLKSVKYFNSALNLEQNGVLNVHIWSKIVGGKVGQYGQNLAKSGQSLEIVS
jgi:hypothetical protein